MKRGSQKSKNKNFSYENTISQAAKSLQTSIDEEVLKSMMSSVNGNSDYITITSPGDVYLDSTMYSGGTVSLSPSISTTYTINTADTITFNDTYTVNWGNKEWVDSFPDFDRVKNMCEKYPGLKVAFDNFKVFYEMCKDDYDNPTPKK